jgi:hypothetical protein
MGQVFYDMGVLSFAEVVECSASDLVGQYVGQTGPKTKKLFEKALGKVLFIDEAYRLSQGHFAQEAIDELVGLLTHPTFKSKLIVILAGYEQDMNHLMSVNTGLSSRFPDQIFFQDMDAEDCLVVVQKELQKKNVRLPNLSDKASALYLDMKEMIRDLSEQKDWGNARDMISLSKELIGQALLKNTGSNTALALDDDDALDVLKKMLTERQRRSKAPVKSKCHVPNLPTQSSAPNPPTPPAINISTQETRKAPPPSSPPETSRPSTPSSATSFRSRGRGGSRGRGRGRGQEVKNRAPPQSHSGNIPKYTTNSSVQDPTQPDPGVSAKDWQDLLAAKRAEEENEIKATNSIRLWEQQEQNDRKKEELHNKVMEDLTKDEASEPDASKRSELQRQREEARLRAHAARVQREKAARELETKREAERKRKEQDAQAQRKLREMGVCPVGFRWINMGTYYRCAGGSHVVSMSELGL